MEIVAIFSSGFRNLKGGTKKHDAYSRHWRLSCSIHKNFDPTTECKETSLPEFAIEVLESR